MARPDWETLVNEGIEARLQGDRSNWRLGDLAGQVETHYGEGDLQKYAERIGVVYKSLLEYRRVAGQFSRRLENLSWTHYQAAAGAERPESWLQRAASGGWSTEKLRAEIQAERVAPVRWQVASTRYRTLVIDPPWPMAKIERLLRPRERSGLDYPTLTVEQIGSWPIAEYAELAGCHVYLWTTHRFLPEALAMLQGWGVEYQCLVTWVKNVGFTPYSWMYSTEHALFGHLGSLDLLVKGQRLDIHAPRREHSRKPDAFYELVRRVSPEPRLDVFSREAREGFDQFGDEVDHFALAD